MIEEYHFGSINIDGKTFHHDVGVLWTGEVFDWRRKESHIVGVEDVEKAVERNPETIIIGTGAYGVCKVNEEVKDFLKEKGIELIIDKTEEAIRTFNIINEESVEEEGEQRKIIGLFHLTC
jgi:hypothetical protein